MRVTTLLTVAATLVVAAPVVAQDTAPPPAVSVSGGATLTTDYRFRGLSRSGGDPAIQGTVTINHQSGLYAGAWASSIDGDRGALSPARSGAGAVELDLYAGYGRTLGSGVGVDAGLQYYAYPDRARGVSTDVFEPYASVSYTLGPVAAKLGAAYAWGGQRALDVTAGSDDSLYTYGEASLGVPTTPVTLKAHLGHSNGALGRANPALADDDYLDWSLNAEAVKGLVKAGVSYVDTDISNRHVPGIGRFAQQLDRGATLLGYVGLSF